MITTTRREGKRSEKGETQRSIEEGRDRSE